MFVAAVYNGGFKLIAEVNVLKAAPASFLNTCVIFCRASNRCLYTTDVPISYISVNSLIDCQRYSTTMANAAFPDSCLVLHCSLCEKHSWLRESSHDYVKCNLWAVNLEVFLILFSRVFFSRCIGSLRTNKPWSGTLWTFSLVKNFMKGCWTIQ